MRLSMARRQAQKALHLATAEQSSVNCFASDLYHGQIAMGLVTEAVIVAQDLGPEDDEEMLVLLRSIYFSRFSSSLDLQAASLTTSTAMPPSQRKHVADCPLACGSLFRFNKLVSSTSC